MNNFPLFLENGRHIGRARLGPEGIITLLLDADFPAYEQMNLLLESGLADGLVIRTRLIPAVDTSEPDKKEEDMPLGTEEINNRFGFHKGTTEGHNPTAPRHASLRQNFKDFAEYLDGVLPEGRAKSVALTELETAAMWAHKAIAQEAPVTDE